MSAEKGDELADLNGFWNWSGKYAGYRLSDNLFSCDGHQVGYFGEGDEVYGCDGGYLGQVRGTDRLITNLSKRLWTRRTLIPRLMKSSQGQRDVDARQMLDGYEDFPVPSAHT
jgi:hypothetical protein